MIPPALSTIAQLLYPKKQAFDFARIVAELETVLTRLRGETIAVTWDCDDLVFFDFEDTRILLACAEFGKGAHATCLTVSVGPPCLQGRQMSHHAVLCSRLVERVQFRFVPAAILWQQIVGPIEADIVDELIDNLPALPPALSLALPSVASILDHVLHSDLSKIAPSPLRTRLAGHGDAAHRKAPARHGAAPGQIGWHLPILTALSRLGKGTQRAARIALPFAGYAVAPATSSSAGPVVGFAEPQTAALGVVRQFAFAEPPVAAFAGPRVSGYAASLAATLAGTNAATRGAPLAASPAGSEVAGLANRPLAPDLANDRPDLPKVKDETLLRLRAALYPPHEPEVDEAPSTQMRLAVHCLNATLILVWMPLGAAVMTYALLKGEDMRLSSRMIAVVGTFLALANSPVGHTVKAMAGV